MKENDRGHSIPVVPRGVVARFYACPVSLNTALSSRW
jgi:hypothetical protein